MTHMLILPDHEPYCKIEVVRGCGAGVYLPEADRMLQPGDVVDHVPEVVAGLLGRNLDRSAEPKVKILATSTKGSGMKVIKKGKPHVKTKRSGAIGSLVEAVALMKTIAAAAAAEART